MGDPFCSRACSEEHHGTGTRANRYRASRQRLAHQLEEGTDAASMELRRVTVDDRAQLIAEGRYGSEFVRAFAAYLIAHKEPVTMPAVGGYVAPGDLVAQEHRRRKSKRRHEDRDDEQRGEQRNRGRGASSTHRRHRLFFTHILQRW